MSGWRLKRINDSFPIEHKLFHMYVKMTRQTKTDVLNDTELDRTPGVTPSAPV